MAQLTCDRFRSNEVRLWLNMLAYNRGNLWPRLALPKRIENGSLSSLQERLVKTGGRLIKHARSQGEGACLKTASSGRSSRVVAFLVVSPRRQECTRRLEKKQVGVQCHPS